MRFVLFHPEMGVYIGHCLGFGFWSKLDPVRQTHAVTFSSVDEIKNHIAGWSAPISDWQAVPLPDVTSAYASTADCVAAGLPGWSADS